MMAQSICRVGSMNGALDRQRDTFDIHPHPLLRLQSHERNLSNHIYWISV
jgi:hypothetical protein